MRSDMITLTVPARSEFAKTVRMTAAELASRLGMTYDEVDDVRMAAEEAFVYASGSMDASGEVTFTFTVTPGALDITVGPLPTMSTAEGTPPVESYAEFILRAVCDEFEYEYGEGTCTLHLSRRVATPTGDAGA